MNALLIYSFEDAYSTRKPISSWHDIQFGISYISSFLRKSGHQVKLLVLDSNDWQNSSVSVKSAISNFAPQVVFFTAISTQYYFIARIAKFIKTYWPRKFLIIGGVHATLNPEKVIGDSFDAVCVGEGEYPALELCECIKDNKYPSGIANLWIKQDNGFVEKNQSRPFIQDLDSLPFPDREIWNPFISEASDAQLGILLGRGCPYNCSYCSNHALKKSAPGCYVRKRSALNIIEELSAEHTKHPNLKSVYFEVETIAMDKVWLLEFCDRLGSFNRKIKNALSYACNFRVFSGSNDEEIFKALKNARFDLIRIGLETGNEELRGKLLRGDYTNDDFLNTVSSIRSHGMRIGLYNIIGLPGETIDKLWETVALNRICQPDEPYTAIFYPYPGTDLHKECVKQGFIKGELRSSTERRNVFVEYPYFTRRQIQSAFDWFPYLVYKGYKPSWKLLIYVLINKLRSKRLVNRWYRKITQMPTIRLLSNFLWSKF